MMLNEQERLQQAQYVLQLTLQALERDFGVTVESGLQIESISSSYATTRAVMTMKLVSPWQPPQTTQQVEATAP